MRYLPIVLLVTIAASVALIAKMGAPSAPLAQAVLADPLPRTTITLTPSGTLPPEGTIFHVSTARYGVEAPCTLTGGICVASFDPAIVPPSTVTAPCYWQEGDFARTCYDPPTKTYIELARYNVELKVVTSTQPPVVPPVVPPVGPIAGQPCGPFTSRTLVNGKIVTQQTCLPADKCVWQKSLSGGLVCHP